MTAVFPGGTSFKCIYTFTYNHTLIDPSQPYLSENEIHIHSAIPIITGQ